MNHWRQLLHLQPPSAYGWHGIARLIRLTNPISQEIEFTVTLETLAIFEILRVDTPSRKSDLIRLRRCGEISSITIEKALASALRPKRNADERKIEGLLVGALLPQRYIRFSTMQIHSGFFPRQERPAGVKAG